MVELKIHRVDKEIELPCYAKEGDAALDLRSCEEKIIKPNQKEVIKTGLRLAIPEKCCGLIWPWGIRGG